MAITSLRLLRPVVVASSTSSFSSFAGGRPKTYKKVLSVRLNGVSPHSNFFSHAIYSGYIFDDRAQSSAKCAIRIDANRYCGIVRLVIERNCSERYRIRCFMFNEIGVVVVDDDDEVSIL